MDFPGCTGPAWLPQRSAIEKRAGQPALVSSSTAWPRREMPFSHKCSIRSSCVRNVTSDPDLEAKVRFSPRLVLDGSFLGEGVCPVEGVVGPCPGFPEGGKGGCTLSLVTCLSWKKGWEPLYLLCSFWALDPPSWWLLWSLDPPVLV